MFNLIAIIIYKLFNINIELILTNKIDIINFINVKIVRILNIIIIINFFIENVVLNINVLNFFRIQLVEYYLIFVNTF